MNNTIILVTKSGLGTTNGDDAFGAEMLDNFFHALESRSNRPAAICFYTEGVCALAKGSFFEAGLRLLQGLGVRLVACETCVQRYGLEESLAVGEVAVMPEIVQLIAASDKVVTV